MSVSLSRVAFSLKSASDRPFVCTRYSQGVLVEDVKDFYLFPILLMFVYSL